MTPVSLSDSIWLHFGTSSASTGAAANADSTPTVTIAEDGVDMAYSPTVSNVTTGLYKVQIDATAANGFEAGRRYSVYVAATVGGIVGRDGLGEFEVLAVDLNTSLDAAVSSRLASGSVSLSASEYAAIADKLLGRNIAGSADGGRTVQDALRATRNKTAISGSTLTVYQEDDTTPAWTATIATGSRDPLTSIDPA